MLVISIIGNVNEPEWQARLDGARLDSLPLDQWEAQKNRLRKLTADGMDVALSLARGVRLRDGDILYWDEAAATAVVARIQLGDVMVVAVDLPAGEAPQQLVRTALELGHALGNQHWPAVVKGGKVYVSLTVDRRVMASVMRTHALPGVSYEFVTGTEVIAFLAPHEAHRLFGGSDPTPHAHVPAGAG